MSINFNYLVTRRSQWDKTTTQQSVLSLFFPNQATKLLLVLEAIQMLIIFLFPDRHHKRPVQSKHRSTHSEDLALNQFCSNIDFLALHRLSTNFNILPPVQQGVVTLVNQELNRIQTAFLQSDDPCPYSSYLGPSCIFMGAASNVPIVIDTGASKGLTPFCSDFISYREMSSKITGIGSQSTVVGVGTVCWTIIDQNQKIVTIETEAYHVPSAKIRLYSPQHDFCSKKSGYLLVDSNQVKLRLPHQQTTVSFPIHSFSSLPLMLLDPTTGDPNRALLLEEDFSGSIYVTSDHTLDHVPFEATITPDETSKDSILCAITDEKNINLTQPQLELLLWHYRLGHISMHHIQRLMHHQKPLDNQELENELDYPAVICTRHKGTQTCITPKCAACILGKMESIGTGTSTSSGLTRGKFRRDDMEPGKTVSMDQYIVTIKGRTLRTAAKENMKFNGGTIFVDHASGKIFNYNQISLRTGETLVGKRILEQEADKIGFKVKGFLANNGVFTSDEFRNDMQRKQQTINFSGVGAHHQNGIAERNIKTISYFARSQLIHAALRWPNQHDLELWPFALDHAVYLWNNIPGSDGLSPEEKWNGIKNPSFDHIRRLHPWGCPAYVLEPKLQDKKKIPKWNPRSRQGKFLGYWKEHATNVGLILNLQTKRISPQFHVLFDDYFTTVRSVDDANDPVLADVNWERMIELVGTDKYFDENDTENTPPILDEEWLTELEIQQRQQSTQRPQALPQQRELATPQQPSIELQRENSPPPSTNPAPPQQVRFENQRELEQEFEQESASPQREIDAEDQHSNVGDNDSDAPTQNPSSEPASPEKFG